MNTHKFCILLIYFHSLAGCLKSKTAPPSEHVYYLPFYVSQLNISKHCIYSFFRFLLLCTTTVTVVTAKFLLQLTLQVTIGPNSARAISAKRVPADFRPELVSLFQHFFYKTCDKSGILIWSFYYALRK